MSEIIFRGSEYQITLRTVTVVRPPQESGNDGWALIELGGDAAYRPIDDDYLVGGWRVVSDLTARDAIQADRRAEGMRVKVVSNGETYELVGGIDNTDWQEAATLPPTTGVDGNVMAEVGSSAAFRPFLDSYLTGGWRVVANLTARDAIPSAQRTEGMRVHVVSNRETYELVGGITNGDWQESETLPPATGTDGNVLAEIGSSLQFRPFLDSYLTGGWRVVADLTARDAIPSAQRTIGMRVHVVSNLETYELVGGITNGDWQESETLPPTTGTDGNALIEVGSSSQFRPILDGYLTGGWRVVADITARDAIPSANRVEGMRVKVQGDDSVYELDGGITNGDWVEILASSSESTGDITLAVNGSTGSDAPTITRPARLLEGDYSSEPFATLQAAIDSLPPITIAGKIEVNITGAGSYTGFSLDGRTFRGAGSFDQDSNEGLVINGLQAQVTPTSGSASGTASGGSVHTLVDTGAGWTVDDFKGKLLHLISGPGAGASGRYLAIAKNTSDTITFATRASPAPANGTVFEIVEPSVVIDTEIIDNPDRGVVVTGCQGSVDINDIKVVIANVGFFIQNNPGRVRCTNIVASSSSGNTFDVDGSGEFVANEVGVLAGAPSIGWTQRVDINGMAIVDTGDLRCNDCPSVDLNGVHTYSGSKGFGIFRSIASMTDCKAEDHSSDGFEINGSRASLNRVAASGNGGNGIEIGRGSYVRALSAIEGSGNGGWGVTVGVAERGGDLVLLALPTITGTSGDATVDGSTALSWASDFIAGGDYAFDVRYGNRIVRG